MLHWRAILFTHELQVATDAGLLGSIDANRGDYQNGWETTSSQII